MNTVISLGAHGIRASGVVINRKYPLMGLIGSIAWRFNGRSLFIDQVASIDQVGIYGYTRYTRSKPRAERWARLVEQTMIVKERLEELLAGLRKIQEEYSRSIGEGEVTAIDLDLDLSVIDELEALEPPT